MKEVSERMGKKENRDELKTLMILANAIVFSISLQIGLVKTIESSKKSAPRSKNSQSHETWNCLFNSANIGERNRVLKKIYTSFSGLGPNPGPFEKEVLGLTSI